MQDTDWAYIIYEFAMNYSIESLRSGYQAQKEKEKQSVDNDLLRQLGYSEDSISQRRI